MKPGKYTIKELFSNRDIEQILIPEIQRDYVWADNQVDSFLLSLMEDYEEFENAQIPFTISSDKDKTIVRNFEEFYKKQKYSSSIGFIYAYNDIEFAGKYFLIDGQQRLTTIYLLILNLYVKLGNQNLFINNYKTGSQLKLDYKVREATSSFFNYFVNFILANGESRIIKSRYWYFSEYNNDTTIQSILTNYDNIDASISSDYINLITFLEYIEDYVEFYYFDTNISEQGEELYLYMNSRGEVVVENENQKAELLREVEDKVTWGIKWEFWQDFFWENKGKNVNADAGFNAFLKWLEEKELKDFIGKYLANVPKLEIIEAFLIAFKILVERDLVVFNNHKFQDFSSMISNESLDIEKKMVLYPSLIYLIKQKYWTFSKNEGYQYSLKLDENLFCTSRVLRFFYNTARKCKDIENVLLLSSTAFWDDNKKDSIDLLEYANNDFLSEKNEKNEDNDQYDEILTFEEVYKLEFFKENLDNRIEFEEAFWALEDHKYLNGKIEDFLFIYGNSEYFYFNDVEVFSKYFFELFPDKKEAENLKKIQSLMLYYGYLGEKKSPYYYDNRYFGNWEKIVQCDEFNNLMKDYDIYKNLDLLILEKKKEILSLSFEDIKKEKKKTRQLYIYSIFFDFIGKDFWKFGDYIAIEWEISKFFEKEWYYTNTKGNQRGNSLTVLNSYADKFDDDFYAEIRKEFDL